VKLVKQITEAAAAQKVKGGGASEFRGFGVRGIGYNVTCSR
jgi:hypothetical protein